MAGRSLSDSSYRLVLKGDAILDDPLKFCCRRMTLRNFYLSFLASNNKKSFIVFSLLGSNFFFRERQRKPWNINFWRFNKRNHHRTPNYSNHAEQMIKCHLSGIFTSIGLISRKGAPCIISVYLGHDIHGLNSHKNTRGYGWIFYLLFLKWLSFIMPHQESDICRTVQEQESN